MSEKTFVQLSPKDGSRSKKTRTVRYYCEGGFSLEEEVSDNIAGIIEKAIEYGRNLKAQEIRRALNVGDGERYG